MLNSGWERGGSPMSENTRPPALSDELRGLSLKDLIDQRDTLYFELDSKPTREEVKSFYKTTVLPLEREFIWREGLEDKPVDLLFITVGAQADTPINAGLRWRAKHVVFLHTDEYRENAVYAAERLGLALGQTSLESVGTGDEALELYRRVKDVWLRLGKPGNTVVDVTGGFKTMSASGGAVAFVMEFRTAYVATRQRRICGEPVWLDTKVKLLDSPLAVFGDVPRQVARQLLHGGRYREAKAAFADLEHKVGATTDTWYRHLAQALADSDSMALEDSAHAFFECVRVMERDVRNQPNLKAEFLYCQLDAIKARQQGIEAVRDMVAQGDGEMTLDAMCCDGFLDFIVYLQTRAQDRYERKEYDFSAMFAYRALEAMSQRRLAKGYGYHVSDFDWTKLLADTGMAMEHFRKVLEKDYITVENRKVDKGTANRILALILKDALVPKNELQRWDGFGQNRNLSVLAHGTSQIKEKSLSDLLANSSKLFQRLLELEGLSEDDREALHRRHAPLKFE